MTQKGAETTYYWLQAAFPKEYRTNASAEFQSTKIRQIYDTYREYTDEEVKAAVQKWAENNEKAPTIKNMLTELKWARALKGRKDADPTALYQMEYITDDGVEHMVAWYKDGKLTTNFTLEEFVNHPQNRDNLSPEEWERRYRIRRRQVLNGKPLQSM